MAKKNQTIIILLSITIFLLVTVLVLFFVKGGFPVKKGFEAKDSGKGEQPVEMVPVGANVSSTLPASYGFSYPAEKSFDGNEFSWWSPEDSRPGQWIEYHLGQPQRLTGIKILNGAHYPNYSNGGVYFGDLYYQNAILTEATLEFSDGTRREINLRVYDGMQTIEFPEVLTSSVKIICRGVKPGERWQDVCISEFRALVAKQE